MMDRDRRTIEAFARRSDRAVLWITVGFALGGAMLDVGAHVLPGLLRDAAGGIVGRVDSLLLHDDPDAPFPVPGGASPHRSWRGGWASGGCAA